MSYEKHKSKYFNLYPAISDLEHKAKKRIPHVAWEYLQTGTGKERLIKRNKDAFDQIHFHPQFCKGELTPDIQTTILDQDFQAPFGIAPVGLTGLMWPRAELILAKTCLLYTSPSPRDATLSRMPSSA